VTLPFCKFADLNRVVQALLPSVCNVTAHEDLRLRDNFPSEHAARMAIWKVADRTTSVSPDRNEQPVFGVTFQNTSLNDEVWSRRLNFAEVVSNVHTEAGRLG
jgi:hypothetical protein